MKQWMKGLILVLVILLVPIFAWSAGTSVNFIWDANTEPDLAGYRMFWHAEGDTYDYTNPVVECLQVGCGVSGLIPGSVNYFVLRAFDTEGFESADSNEVVYTVPQPWEGVPPGAPTNLTIELPSP